MSRRRCLRVLGVTVTAALLHGLLALGALAQELLPNGDFEQGTEGWFLIDLVASDCTGRGGSSALGAAAAPGQAATLQRNLFGPFPAGLYTFSGWARIPEGAGAVMPELELTLQGGSPVVGRPPATLPISDDYAFFSFSASSGSQAVEDVRLYFRISGSGGETLCLDDLRLVGPDPLPVATETPLPTGTPDAPPEDPQAATATATPSTATPQPSTTAVPSATVSAPPPASSGPSFTFVNGGFEDGTTGWSKHGGELTTRVGGSSGSAAGSLVSSTESTKWAYQAIAVDAELFYEFQGMLRADAGVREAYLRISWYTSADGTGSANGTSDSLARISGPSSGFVHVSTGAISPPPGTRSARARVMLAPASTATAVLLMDEMSFATADTPTPTPVPTATPPPTATPSATPSVTPSPQSASQASEVAPPPTLVSFPTQTPFQEVQDERQTRALVTPSATPELISEVSSTSWTADPVPASPGGDAEERDSPATHESEGDGDGFPLTWLLGGGLFAAGLAGAYFQGRRPRT